MYLEASLFTNDFVDGRLQSRVEILPMHPCNENDIFFKPKENVADGFQFAIDSALCFDNLQDIEIWGNFDSTKAQVIRVRVMRCSGKSTCKSDEEIDEFID